MGRGRAGARSSDRAGGGAEASGAGQAPLRLRLRGPALSVFADSSAIVKLYVDEPGHERIRSIGALTVSALARVEVAAAIWRKHRAGELEESDATLLVTELEADLLGDDGGVQRLIAVPLRAPLLKRAAGLARTRALRAYDAVQLASALAARLADPELGAFACFDADLREAAAAEGFRILPTG